MKVFKHRVEVLYLYLTLKCGGSQCEDYRARAVHDLASGASGLILLLSFVLLQAYPECAEGIQTGDLQQSSSEYPVD